MQNSLLTIRTALCILQMRRVRVMGAVRASSSPAINRMKPAERRKLNHRGNDMRIYRPMAALFTLLGVALGSNAALAETPDQAVARCNQIAKELREMSIDDTAEQKVVDAKAYWSSANRSGQEATEACNDMWRAADSKAFEVTRYKQAKAAKGSAGTCRELAGKHRKVIEGAGVKGAILDQPIYLVEYAGAPFTPWMTVREWMGCMLEKGKVEKIEGASKGFMGDAGVHIKPAGQQGIHLLFSAENNQLYPSYYGLPDSLQRLDNPVKQQQIGDLMRNLIK